MLVFISDLHLSDGSVVDQNISTKQVEDFWHNINRSKRKLLSFTKQAPSEIEIVLLGDFLDLIRSTQWNQTDGLKAKPWGDPNPAQKATLKKVIEGIFKKNAEPLRILKRFFAQKQVKVHYLVGNHDHLLLHHMDLFEYVHKQLGIEFPEDTTPRRFYERFWPNYGVYAHHGDCWDTLNNTRGLLPPLGDCLVTELYNRFPDALSKRLKGGEESKKALANLVYVRPYRFTPLWVLSTTKQYGEETLVRQCWNELFGEFMALDFVQSWIKEHKKTSGFNNPATALKASFKISRRLQMKSWVSVTRWHNLIRQMFSGESSLFQQVQRSVQELANPDIRFLVNGHTHNPGVLSLGKVNNNPVTYVNSGTWTRAFLPDRYDFNEPVDDPMVNFTSGDFLAYVMFYSDQEDPNHNMEFWSGRIQPRDIH